MHELGRGERGGAEHMSSVVSVESPRILFNPQTSVTVSFDGIRTV